MKKIKEVSRISGLSKRTLQFYDEIGLISPERSSENYRIYSEEEIKRLWEILIYKEMGFELREIKGFFVEGESLNEKLNFMLNRLYDNKLEIERTERLIQHVLESGMPNPKGKKSLKEEASELFTEENSSNKKRG